MCKILIQEKHPLLRSSPCVSCLSHNHLKRNSNDMLLPFPRVKAIRMNFIYQFVKVRLEMPKLITCERSYLQFKNTLSGFYLVQY